MTTAGIGSYWWNLSLASDRERANLPRQVTGMEGQRAVIMDAGTQSRRKSLLVDLRLAVGIDHGLEAVRVLVALQRLVGAFQIKSSGDQ